MGLKPKIKICNVAWRTSLFCAGEEIKKAKKENPPLIPNFMIAITAGRKKNASSYEYKDNKAKDSVFGIVPNI